MSSNRESRGVPGIMVIAGLVAAFNLGYSTGVQNGRCEVSPPGEVAKTVGSDSQKEEK